MITTLSVVGGFITADIITGVISALATGKFESRIMREAIPHKLGEVFAMLMCCGCEYALPLVGIEIPMITKIMAGYLIIMEIGSLIENIGEMNPELVKPLQNIFKKFKEK